MDISFTASIPIQVDNNFSVFKYSSYSRGYHAYMNVWLPIIGDSSLMCKKEDTNDHDQNAVAIVFDNLISKKVVGHVPLYWSELAAKFLRFPNHKINVTVTDKRCNRGAGLGLEVPVDYMFYGDVRVLEWLKKNIEKKDSNITEKVNKCLN